MTTGTLGQPSDLRKLKRATAEEAGTRNELSWLLVLDNLVDAGTVESHWARPGRDPARPGRDPAQSGRTAPGSAAHPHDDGLAQRTVNQG